MSTSVVPIFGSADLAGGALTPTLPMRKRKKSDEADAAPFQTAELSEPSSSSSNKLLKTSTPPQTTVQQANNKTSSSSSSKRPPMSKAREVRLEQNRKAARESRRRKKVMIEELQRSVIFFSRANGTLKQQNDELARLFISAKAQVSAIESGKTAQQDPTKEPAAPQTQVPAPATITTTTTKTDSLVNKPALESTKEEVAAGAAAGGTAAGGESFQQAQADAVAAQALYQSQGFPSAAARVVAQTLNTAVCPQSTGVASQEHARAQPAGHPSLPPMQPGATMQAMANFQQAAAAAMQSAMQGMHGIPGVNLGALAATQVCANPQQAYTDTMTALAMQQAAAAAAGQQFAIFQPGSFIAHPMLAWQNQAAVANVALPAPIPATKTEQPTQN